MSVSEYRKIANKYITAFLKTIPSKEYLLLDGADHTGGTNLIQMKKEYWGDYKSLIVYRDPRDIYATGIKKNVSWIPRDLETFVKWYSYLLPDYLKNPSSNFLLIRFEDFCLNYEETSKKINEYVGLDEKNHIYPRKYFNPDSSKNNIGLYNSIDNQEIIKDIERELKEYCYYQN